MSPLARFLHKWSAALAAYEEASARFNRVTGEYLALIGTPKHGEPGAMAKLRGERAQLYTETEVRILAKKDFYRQKAISDQQFWSAEATMYGIAALVEMLREEG
ncbi:MAG TPA: hypothetical protein VE326_11360 [Candidatus Binatia bacterium]|nr:hypothetical protein [Candidatus Binatia bacterium]